MRSAFTSFRCGNCHTEIEASPDMIGQETECPACGARIIIPEPATDSVMRHTAGADDPRSIEAMKSKTIRIELGDI